MGSLTSGLSCGRDFEVTDCKSETPQICKIVKRDA